MMSILDHSYVSQMDVARARVERIGVGINNWSFRGRSWRNDPLSAGDLGLEEAISEDRNDRDRIKDEDQQDHCVDQIDVQPVERHRKHTLEADPVEQRQRPGDFRIPWAPEPIRSARRRRLRGCLVHLIRFGKFLHEQSLSGKKNSTDDDVAKPSAALVRSDETARSCDFGLPTTLSPLQVGPFLVPIPTYFAGRAVTQP